MSAEPYWLSRITPRSDLSYRQLVSLGDLDPYGQHQALWKLFDVASKERSNRAEFLYRAEQLEGLPLFFVLSRKPPRDQTGMWRIEPKSYSPDIRADDRLAFKLRANPVLIEKVERSADESTLWQTRRVAQGLKSKDPTKKRVRHDVVMDAKKRLGWKDMAEDSRPTLAHLAYEAGTRWLLDHHEYLGCTFESKVLRVDGYRTWRLRGRKNIEMSTLDFEGTLTVNDQKRFMEAALNGVGPAKAFGCGLLLVRRV